MLTHYSSLSRAEVAEQIIKCGGLAPIVAMVSSEHDVMQNEALIALTIISSTVKGWICSSICVCVCVCECDVWSRKYKAVEVTVFVKKNILVQYSDNFMHGFVKFLFVFTVASFFIVMLFYSVVMWRQYNAMPRINLSEYWTTLTRKKSQGIYDMLSGVYFEGRGRTFLGERLKEKFKGGHVRRQRNKPIPE